MRLIEDHIIRKVNGNVVLVPVSTRETDFQGMLLLNHTGAFLCELLKKETDRDRLAEALAIEYGKEPEQVKADVDAFLSELDACHVLIR